MGKREKDINKQSIQFQSQNNIQSKSNPPGSMSPQQVIQFRNTQTWYEKDNIKKYNYNSKMGHQQFEILYEQETVTFVLLT